ncbi:MAG: efflux RND transporter permease subunit, partial [Flavobacteriales bacterium]|nr:efflux RND transporter permease subunit [Flavobacteriales bacterium]
MVFGMLPIALATGTGSEWKNGLAWVIIGGLTSSMLLTVYLVPVMYHLLEGAKERVTGWWARRHSLRPSVPDAGTANNA